MPTARDESVAVSIADSVEMSGEVGRSSTRCLSRWYAVVPNVGHHLVRTVCRIIWVGQNLGHDVFDDVSCLFKVTSQSGRRSSLGQGGQRIVGGIHAPQGTLTPMRARVITGTQVLGEDFRPLWRHSPRRPSGAGCAGRVHVVVNDENTSPGDLQEGGERTDRAARGVHVAVPAREKSREAGHAAGHQRTSALCVRERCDVKVAPPRALNTSRVKYSRRCVEWRRHAPGLPNRRRATVRQSSYSIIALPRACPRWGRLDDGG